MNPMETYLHHVPPLDSIDYSIVMGNDSDHVKLLVSNVSAVSDYQRILTLMGDLGLWKLTKLNIVCMVVHI